MTQSRDEDYGALVGWTSTRTGNRISLHLQSVSKPPPYSKGDIRTQIYLMDRNQATQLGNFLFEMGETTPPEKRDRSWLKRMFG
ncbi:hypothetical protein [Aurantiacibacter marinus]|uniref:hypothetical protein n=1 Tax=Aurantiacibacter marinus TaxID=874156 RepID=UPI00063D146E|nr:hypothetical protein [Aurantiacibacter marinus]